MITYTIGPSLVPLAVAVAIENIDSDSIVVRSDTDKDTMFQILVDPKNARSVKQRKKLKRAGFVRGSNSGWWIKGIAG